MLERGKIDAGKTGRNKVLNQKYAVTPQTNDPCHVHHHPQEEGQLQAVEDSAFDSDTR